MTDSYADLPERSIVIYSGSNQYYIQGKINFFRQGRGTINSNRISDILERSANNTLPVNLKTLGNLEMIFLRDVHIADLKNKCAIGSYKDYLMPVADILFAFDKPSEIIKDEKILDQHQLDIANTISFKRNPYEKKIFHIPGNIHIEGYVNNTISNTKKGSKFVNVSNAHVSQMTLKGLQSIDDALEGIFWNSEGFFVVSSSIASSTLTGFNL